MADFHDKDDQLLILNQTHQAVITDAISPGSLDRKVGLTKTTRVFNRFQILADVLFNVPLRRFSKLGKLFFCHRIKENLPLHRLYFFLISDMGIGLPGFSNTASTSDKSSASSIASRKARATSFISSSERLGTSFTISATLMLL